MRLPRCENMSDIDLYQQLVLRLPEALASKVQAVMNRTSEAVPIEVIPEGSSFDAWIFVCLFYIY